MARLLDQWLAVFAARGWERTDMSAHEIHVTKSADSCEVLDADIRAAVDAPDPQHYYTIVDGFMIQTDVFAPRAGAPTRTWRKCVIFSGDLDHLQVHHVRKDGGGEHTE